MIDRRLALVALPLLASCGSILPKPPPPPALYRLTPLPAAAPAGPPVDAQLLVTAPMAAASLDTTRIALTRGAFGFDYFADAAWTDRATAMMQALVIESVEAQGRIRVVTGGEDQIRSDAVLASVLRDFEAAYGAGETPEVRVRLDCLLVRPTDRSVLAIRSFSGTDAAAANDMTAIVAGFDAALHQALGDLPAWLAAALERGPR